MVRIKTTSCVQVGRLVGRIELDCVNPVEHFTCSRVSIKLQRGGGKGNSRVLNFPDFLECNMVPARASEGVMFTGKQMVFSVGVIFLAVC